MPTVEPAGTMNSNSGAASAKRPAARVLSALGREAWAITPAALEVMVDIAARTLAAPDAVLRKSGEELEGASWRVQVLDGVAVIPVRGPIFRHASMFDAICGATSVERLAKDLAAAVDSPEVRGIVLDIDSPGGQITGIHEFAAQIVAACEKKRVVAYVGGMGASAAYWLASAASEIVADRTAWIGSIGVVSVYTDTSKQDEMLGVKEIEIVSSQSPKKRMSPTTKDGRAAIQELVDGLADVFVDNVAVNRGKSSADVLENFGQGGVMIAEAAVAVGMADRLGSLEGVISEIAATAGRSPVFGAQAEEANMPGTEKPLTAEAVDAAWLAANRPELVAGIKAEATTEERGRIAGILALGVVGHDELVKSAMVGEKTMTAADVALAVFNAEKGARTKAGQDMESDAVGATVPASGPAHGSEDDAAAAAVDAAAVAAMNAGRK